MDRQNVNRQKLLYPRQMVKATLSRSEHTKKLTYSHSQKGKRRKKRKNKQRSPKMGAMIPINKPINENKLKTRQANMQTEIMV